ncbi:MAG: undecaprenyl/decaprenyl-phosphate alpha-N-acetylglucosaminyl 1-phosphate transferase [Planctomycetes bacterium]|nr:undecaprenyl/decaprenyl-phosphate alpha-N-acetylglucosaminyl 1-phosphate transferase [Planctomycetota bacterium]
MSLATMPFSTWHDATPTLALVFAAILGMFFTPRMRQAAERFGIVDKPDGRLKTQGTPVAYLGGLAIYLAFLVTLGVWVDFEQRVLGLLLGSTLVLLLGLVDDLEAQTPTVKFAGQILAVFVLMKAGIRIQITWLEGVPYLAETVTLLWIVGLTNAFNIIDVMDGLAAGTAGVALLGLGAMAWWNGDIAIASFTFALAGAAFGFLRFNVQPARIYLGDAGSMLLGFLVAALATQASWAKHSPYAVAAPIVLLAVPIFDTALVSFHRLKRGCSPFRGSPDHFAVRLRRNGFSARVVAPVTWGIATICAALALALTKTGDRGSLAILGGVLGAGLAIGIWVSRFDGRAPSAQPR